MKKVLLMLVIPTLSLQAMQTARSNTLYTRGEWMHAIYSDNITKLQELLNRGTNVNSPDHEGVTLLMVASHLDRPKTIEFLVKAGAFIDKKDNELGYTALHNAVAANSAEAVQKLTDLGANPFIRNAAGTTPLEIAQDPDAFVIDDKARKKIVKILKEYIEKKPLDETVESAE